MRLAYLACSLSVWLLWDCLLLASPSALAIKLLPRDF